MNTVSITKIKDTDNDGDSVANDHKDIESSATKGINDSNDIKMDVSALMNLLDKNGSSDDIKKTSGIKKRSLDLSIPKDNVDLSSKNSELIDRVNAEKNDNNAASVNGNLTGIENSKAGAKKNSQEEKLERLRKNCDISGNSLSINKIIPVVKKTRDTRKSSSIRIVIFVIFLLLMIISFAGVVYFVDEKTKTWNNAGVEYSSEPHSIKEEKGKRMIVPTKQLKTEEEKQLLNIIGKVN